MTREYGPSKDGDPTPSAELRDLYRSLQPPRPADEACAADPRTARAVAWMRAAWTQLEIPEAAPPSRTLARPRSRWPGAVGPRVLGLAAAAVALALAGAALWPRSWRADPSEPPASLAQSEGIPGNSSAVPASGHDGIQVITSAPDRLELLSGPVRLMLLDTPPTTSETLPGS